jgi:hypothetical protein
MAYRTYAGALRAALSKMDGPPVDKAAVQLATGYAKALDSGGNLLKFGPLLLAVLESLGMTPKSRAAILGKGVSNDGSHTSNPLDELRRRREQRRARQDPAAAVDTTAG